MDKKFAVKVNGHILKWEDGKYDCNNRAFLRILQDACKNAEEQPHLELWLDGSMLYGGKGLDPQKNWSTAYAFLQDLTGDRMKFISGEKPTWEKLGYKAKEGEIN